MSGFARGHIHLFGVGCFGGFELFCDGDCRGDFDGVVGLGVAEDGVGLGGGSRGVRLRGWTALLVSPVRL